MKTIVIINLKGGVAKTATAVNVAAIQASAKRIIAAAERGAIPDSKKIPVDYSQLISIREVREYAAGEFGTKYFYSNPLDFRSDRLFKLADSLNCSADYLLCRTEDPALDSSAASTGAAAWTEGVPTESGLYVMVTNFCGDEYPADIYRFNANTGLIYYPRLKNPISEMECLRYIKLPED